MVYVLVDYLVKELAPLSAVANFLSKPLEKELVWGYWYFLPHWKV
jgi:hypothetical protein